MMPFYKAAELLGDRWTLLIARQFLIEGSISYTELLRRIPGIATNILSSRLEKLVSHGVIEVATDKPTSGGAFIRQVGRWRVSCL
jgi:DNA-binding HxlR family transcriptional regulator